MEHFLIIFAFRNAIKNRTMANNSEKNAQTIPVSVVGDLAEAFKRSFGTIYRWIEKNDDRLTSDKAKEVFAEHGYEYSPSDSVGAVVIDK